MIALFFKSAFLEKWVGLVLGARADPNEKNGHECLRGRPKRTKKQPNRVVRLGRLVGVALRWPGVYLNIV